MGALDNINRYLTNRYLSSFDFEEFFLQKRFYLSTRLRTKRLFLMKSFFDTFFLIDCPTFEKNGVQMARY